MLRRVGAPLSRLGRRSKSTALSMEVTPQGVAMLRLDCPGEAQNTLSMELIQEFDQVRTPAPCPRAPERARATIPPAPCAVDAGDGAHRGG